MKQKLLVGQRVTVRSVDGNVTRTIAGIYEGIVGICTEEEYRRAKTERREPLAVGFKLADVIGFEPDGS